MMIKILISRTYRGFALKLNILFGVIIVIWREIEIYIPRKIREIISYIFS